MATNNQGGGPVSRRERRSVELASGANLTPADRPANPPATQKITRDQVFRTGLGSSHVLTTFLNGPGLWVLANGAGSITAVTPDGDVAWTNGVNGAWDVAYHPTRDELIIWTGNRIWLLAAADGSRNATFTLPSSIRGVAPDTARDGFWVARQEHFQFVDASLDPKASVQFDRATAVAYDAQTDTMFGLAGGVVALDAENLAVKWERGLGLGDDDAGIFLVGQNGFAFIGTNRGKVFKFDATGRRVKQVGVAGQFPNISFYYTTDFGSDQSSTDLYFTALERYNVWIEDPDEGAILSLDQDLNVRWGMHLGNTPPNSAHTANIGGSAGLAVGTGSNLGTDPGGVGAIWKTNAPIAGDGRGPGDLLPSIPERARPFAVMLVGAGVGAGGTYAEDEFANF